MSQKSIRVGNRTIYVQANGLKNSKEGKVKYPAEAVLNLTKGEKRKLRKALDKMGRRDLCLKTFATAGPGLPRLRYTASI